MSKHKKIKHEKLLNWKRKLFENSNRLKGFNEKIQEGPSYICVCCEEVIAKIIQFYINRRNTFLKWIIILV